MESGHFETFIGKSCQLVGWLAILGQAACLVEYLGRWWCRETDDPGWGLTVAVFFQPAAVRGAPAGGIRLPGNV